MEKAQQWYNEHKTHVDNLLKKDATNLSFRPSLEDLYRPELWKAGHWLWFLENK